MDPVSRLELLTTVAGSFEARVVAARLATEEIRVELRGLAEGPYPLPGTVDVLVFTEDLGRARELLLADAIDAAFTGELDATRRRLRVRELRLRRSWVRRRGSR